MSKPAAKKSSNTRLQKLKNMPQRIVRFFKGMWSEVKKITWLSRRELLQHTGVVFGLVAIMTLIFWIGDSIFGALTSLIL